MELGYDFALSTVNWEPGLLIKLKSGCERNTDYVMVFAVDSEKEGRILTGELWGWIRDVLDLVDDIKVVIRQRVEGKDALKVGDWKD